MNFNQFQSQTQETEFDFVLDALAGLAGLAGPDSSFLAAPGLDSDVLAAPGLDSGQSQSQDFDFESDFD